MSTGDRTLEYWMSFARMGFEDDLHRLMEEKEVSRTALAKAIDASPAYISQLLNGAGGNFTLKTMTKLARALDALVQIRLVLDGSEVVRVMSVEEARHFDDRKERESADGAGEQVGPPVDFHGSPVNRPKRALIVAEDPYA